MAAYIVHLTSTVSTAVQVEADDKAAAIEAALVADTPTLCAYCSGYGQAHNLEMSGEWDVVDDDSVYLLEAEEGAEDT